MSNSRVLALLAAGCILSACGGDGSTGPDPEPKPEPEAPARPGIKVVAGGSAGDTTGAIPVQALVVEVRGADGKVAPGVTVHFRALEVPPPAACPVVESICFDRPGMLMSRLTSDAFLYADSIAANSEGRASVRTRFGDFAGESRIVVSVPALGFQDTVRFTVRPGSAHRAVVAPRQAMAYLGTTFSRRGIVVDRHGNERPEASTLSSGGGLRVEGTRVTAERYGGHQLRAEYPGIPGDSVYVGVVPRGTIAFVKRYWYSDSILVAGLDGSNLRGVWGGGAGQQVVGFDWKPDGSGFVASIGQWDRIGRLYSIDLDGSSRPLFADTARGSEVFPNFSADGRWLFFAGTDGRMWRARPDGSGVEQVGPARFFSPRGVAPSPDGSRVAFAARSEYRSWIYDLRSGRETDLAMGADAVRWSPGGDLLAVHTYHLGPGVVDPGRADISVGAVRWFSGAYNTPVNNSQIDWSSDGKWILFQEPYYLGLMQMETGLPVFLLDTREYTQVALKP
jgi:hypothetical protein